MSGKVESPRPMGSPRKSKNKGKHEKESKKKTLYKPSRVTVEYYSNNADTVSPAQKCASPERRSVKEAKRHSGFGSSPRRSNPLSPKRPSTPLSSARSPMSIRSQLSSLSRKFRKEALLSDDELRIATMTSPQIEESDMKEKYEPPARMAVTSPRIEKNTPVTPKGRIEKNTPVTSVSIERNAHKLPVLVPSGSISSTENDRYEMAESNSKHTRKTSGFVEMKGMAPNRPSVYDSVGTSTSALSRQEAGVFTDDNRTFATDTYADTYDQDTFSVETTTRKRSFLHYRFSKTLSDGSSLGDGSLIISQQVAWGCIFLSAAQFALLTTQVLMCGIAKLNINPTIGPYPDAFSEWGGKNVYLLVQEEQYFRMITPTFLHVGYLHLLVNAFFQLETCAYLEREWGFSTWISIYLLSGFGSCLAASAIDPNIIGVCSSGALMGLFGARIAQAIIWSSFQPRHEYLGQGALIFERLGGIVCSASVVFFLTFLTYIDWSGHLGGFTTGFLAGLMIFPYAVKGGPARATLRFTGLLGMLVGGIVLGVILFHYAETDEELADVCDYFRNLYAEGYNCECQAFD